MSERVNEPPPAADSAGPELVPTMESHRLSDLPRLKRQQSKGTNKIGTVMPTNNERGGC